MYQDGDTNINESPEILSIFLLVKILAFLRRRKLGETCPTQIT